MSVATLRSVSDTLATYVKPTGRGQRTPSLLAVGEVHGRLTAHPEFQMRPRTDGRRRAYQRFECVCGAEVWLSPYSVKSGNTSSCGCLHSETIAERMTTHGHTRDRSSAEFLAYRAELTQRRRARIKSNGFERISLEEFDKILSEYNNSCWICEVTLDSVEWDHYQPVAQGGPHTVSNVRPSCKPCNTRKSDLWPFTDEMKSRIAAEVRALRSSQSPSGAVTDGSEVTFDVSRDD